MFRTLNFRPPRLHVPRVVDRRLRQEYFANSDMPFMSKALWRTNSNLADPSQFLTCTRFVSTLHITPIPTNESQGSSQWGRHASALPHARIGTRVLAIAIGNHPGSTRMKVVMAFVTVVGQRRMVMIRRGWWPLLLLLLLLYGREADRRSILSMNHRWWNRVHWTRWWWYGCRRGCGRGCGRMSKRLTHGFVWWRDSRSMCCARRSGHGRYWCRYWSRYWSKRLSNSCPTNTAVFALPEQSSSA